jgi:hypothetical protein
MTDDTQPIPPLDDVVEEQPKKTKRSKPKKATVSLECIALYQRRGAVKGSSGRRYKFVPGQLLEVHPDDVEQLLKDDIWQSVES